MAPTSSGTYDFALSNSDIVLESYDRISVRPPAITSNHMVSARRSLNLELQAWSLRGVNLWLVDLVNVPLVANQSVYAVDPKTIDILDVYYSTPTGGGPTIDRILEPISRTDYASYSMKTLGGTPTVYWFDRLNSPTLTLWQPPLLGSPYSISYYRVIRAQDANLGSGELPDINYRFTDALCAGLAARLSEKYAPAMFEAKQLIAKMTWDAAAGEDHEKVAMHITPQLAGYWN